MSPQYGELRLTSSRDHFVSLRHPTKFQPVSRLGSVTARHVVVGVSQTLRRWIEVATNVRQGDHHDGHWPAFLVIFFYSSPNLSGRRLDVFRTKATPCGLSANLECMSEMCSTRFAENKGRKKRHLRHHRTLSGYIFATKARIDNRGKNVKEQYLPHMPLQYGELWPTNGWDLLANFGHPIIFQRVSPLDSVTARQSSTGRHPNFAALNRGRHLYSAGRLSRWPLAHILV